MCAIRAARAQGGKQRQPQRERCTASSTESRVNGLQAATAGVPDAGAGHDAVAVNCFPIAQSEGTPEATDRESSDAVNSFTVTNIPPQ